MKILREVTGFTASGLDIKLWNDLKKIASDIEVLTTYKAKASRIESRGVVYPSITIYGVTKYEIPKEVVAIIKKHKYSLYDTGWSWNDAKSIRGVRTIKMRIKKD